MTVSTTQPIHVDVETHYIDAQSAPAEHRFVFSYTITITNQSNEDVQLLSRHWLITDGNEDIQEVEGDGVVGQQPKIAAGNSFRYTSGAMLKTAAGTMEGSYKMVSASGTEFKAPIGIFPLIHPTALH